MKNSNAKAIEAVETGNIPADMLALDFVHASALITHGDPELIASVRKGLISIHGGAVLASLRGHNSGKPIAFLDIVSGLANGRLVNFGGAVRSIHKHPGYVELSKPGIKSSIIVIKGD